MVILVYIHTSAFLKCFWCYSEAGFPLGEFIRANKRMWLVGDVVSVCHQPIKLLLPLFARTNSPSGKPAWVHVCPRPHRQAEKFARLRWDSRTRHFWFGKNETPNIRVRWVFLSNNGANLFLSLRQWVELLPPLLINPGKEYTGPPPYLGSSPIVSHFTLASDWCVCRNSACLKRINQIFHPTTLNRLNGIICCHKACRNLPFESWKFLTKLLNRIYIVRCFCSLDNKKNIEYSLFNL